MVRRRIRIRRRSKESMTKLGRPRKGEKRHKLTRGPVVNESGNPTSRKWNVHTQHAVLCLAGHGLSDDQIGEALKFSPKVIRVWREGTKFNTSLEAARNKVNRSVEKSLLKRALGFEYTEQSIAEGPGKKVVKTATKKYVVASVTACMKWLTNNAPERWREKVEHVVSGEVRHSLVSIVKAAQEHRKGIAPDLAVTMEHGEYKGIKIIESNKIGGNGKNGNGHKGNGFNLEGF